MVQYLYQIYVATVVKVQFVMSDSLHNWISVISLKYSCTEIALQISFYATFLAICEAFVAQIQAG